ncbi:LOW QUALITY PROTEIN: hypothetical protein ENH_00009180 [Eimeria necatrix]|uniref:Uncharacterized protein n=1 Tax=Eimeria necatrix TaxID=51315 RepID=U6MIG4_9EIME|nr:LOW QUALITY PROTEIN: hypothetical protein ENH_00009180 [Eimeria necatrix]CDJ62244.1 hypothetical protein ENH_00009180 [Eimeria necatrix]
MLGKLGPRRQLSYSFFQQSGVEFCCFVVLQDFGLLNDNALQPLQLVLRQRHFLGFHFAQSSSLGGAERQSVHLLVHLGDQLVFHWVTKFFCVVTFNNSPVFARVFFFVILRIICILCCQRASCCEAQFGFRVAALATRQKPAAAQHHVHDGGESDQGSAQGESCRSLVNLTGRTPIKMHLVKR